MITLYTFIRLAILFVLTIISISISSDAEAKQKIIYIPLDNRPVCLDYVKQTVAAAGYELVTPPKKMLASNNHSGKPDALWSWLNNAAENADIAVLATDSLIYGGLVASRTHNDSEGRIEDRIKKFEKLRGNYPSLKMYAFSTIMRTPRQSFGNVEPPYYEKYGPEIFTLSQLYDKEEGHGLTRAEQISKEVLLEHIPQKSLNDWFMRRQKNFRATLKLTQLSRKRVFHYLALGKDDDAPLSQTHLESRHLMETTLDLSENRFKILSGVDQLGLLLITRAINEIDNKEPIVNVIYSEGEGKNTLPYYSDQRLSTSVPDQIRVMGGQVSERSDNADFILAINTPFDGITKDSTAIDNLVFSSIYNKRFVNLIAALIKDNKKVAIADISYANGADNGFMEELKKQKLLKKLLAYSGWNTADNAVGYAISQGVLSSNMSPPNKYAMLQTRYLDDWLYQANIRPILRDTFSSSKPNIIYNIKPYSDDIIKSTYHLFESYMQKDSFLQIPNLKIKFPWNRLFEINIIIK